MEPFTLTIWLWMGARFEETQIPNMGRGECVELKMTIESDRGHGRTMKGQCIGAGGYILPMDRPNQPCAPASAKQRLAAYWSAMEHPALRGRSILVVENELLIAMAIVQALEGPAPTPQ